MLGQKRAINQQICMLSYNALNQQIQNKNQQILRKLNKIIIKQTFRKLKYFKTDNKKQIDATQNQNNLKEDSPLQNNAMGESLAYQQPSIGVMLIGSVAYNNSTINNSVVNEQITFEEQYNNLKEEQKKQKTQKLFIPDQKEPLKYGDIIYLKFQLDKQNKKIVKGDGIASDNLQGILRDKSGGLSQENIDELDMMPFDYQLAELQTKKCFFQIQGEQQYFIQNKNKQKTQNSILQNSSEEDESIESQFEKDEKLQNENHCKQILGTPVKNGDLIQLQHIYSKCYIMICQNELSPEGFQIQNKVKLTDKPNKDCNIKCKQLIFSINRDNFILYDDKVELFDMNNKLRVNFSNLNDKNNLSVEINASEPEPHQLKQIYFKFQLYRSYEQQQQDIQDNQENTYLRSGIICSISCAQNDDYLGINRKLKLSDSLNSECNFSDMSIFKQQMKIKDIFSFKSYNVFSNNYFWEIERQNNLIAGYLEYDEIVRIKNVVHGVFLAYDYANDKMTLTYQGFIKNCLFRIKKPINYLEQKLNQNKLIKKDDQIYIVPYQKENKTIHIEDGELQISPVGQLQIREFDLKENQQKYQMKLGFSSECGEGYDASKQNKIKKIQELNHFYSFHTHFLKFLFFIQDNKNLDIEDLEYFEQLISQYQEFNIHIDEIKQSISNLDQYMQTDLGDSEILKEKQMQIRDSGIIDLFLIFLTLFREQFFHYQSPDKNYDDGQNEYSLNNLQSIKNLQDQIIKNLQDQIIKNLNICVINNPEISKIILNEKNFKLFWDQLDTGSDNILKLLYTAASQISQYKEKNTEHWFKYKEKITYSNIYKQTILIKMIILCVSNQSHENLENEYSKFQESINKKILNFDNDKPLNKPLIEFKNDKNEFCISFQNDNPQYFEKNNQELITIYKNKQEVNASNQFPLKFLSSNKQDQNNIEIISQYENYIINFLELFKEMCKGRNRNKKQQLQMDIKLDFYGLKSDNIKQILQCKEIDQIKLLNCLLGIFCQTQLNKEPLISIQTYHNQIILLKDINDFNIQNQTYKIFKEIKKDEKGEQRQPDPIAEENGILNYYIDMFIDNQGLIGNDKFFNIVKYINKEGSNCDSIMNFFLTVLNLIRDSIDLGYNNQEKNDKIQRIVIYILIMIDQDKDDIKSIKDTHWIQNFIDFANQNCKDKNLITQIKIKSLEILQIIQTLNKNIQLIQIHQLLLKFITQNNNFSELKKKNQYPIRDLLNKFTAQDFLILYSVIFNKKIDPDLIQFEKKYPDDLIQFVKQYPDDLIQFVKQYPDSIQFAKKYPDDIIQFVKKYPDLIQFVKKYPDLIQFVKKYNSESIQPSQKLTTDNQFIPNIELMISQKLLQNKPKNIPPLIHFKNISQIPYIIYQKLSQNKTDQIEQWLPYQNISQQLLSYIIQDLSIVNNIYESSLQIEIIEDNELYSKIQDICSDKVKNYFKWDNVSSKEDELIPDTYKEQSIQKEYDEFQEYMKEENSSIQQVIKYITELNEIFSDHGFKIQNKLDQDNSVIQSMIRNTQMVEVWILTYNRELMNNLKQPQYKNLGDIYKDYSQQLTLFLQNFTQNNKENQKLIIQFTENIIDMPKFSILNYKILEELNFSEIIIGLLAQQSSNRHEYYINKICEIINLEQMNPLIGKQDKIKIKVQTLIQYFKILISLTSKVQNQKLILHQLMNIKVFKQIIQPYDFNSLKYKDEVSQMLQLHLQGLQMMLNLSFNYGLGKLETQKCIPFALVKQIISQKEILSFNYELGKLETKNALDIQIRKTYLNLMFHIYFKEIDGFKQNQQKIDYQISHTIFYQQLEYAFEQNSQIVDPSDYLDYIIDKEQGLLNIIYQFLMDFIKKSQSKNKQQIIKQFIDRYENFINCILQDKMKENNQIYIQQQTENIRFLKQQNEQQQQQSGEEKSKNQVEKRYLNFCYYQSSDETKNQFFLIDAQAKNYISEFFGFYEQNKIDIELINDDDLQQLFFQGKQIQQSQIIYQITILKCLLEQKKPKSVNKKNKSQDEYKNAQVIFAKEQKFFKNLQLIIAKSNIHEDCIQFLEINQSAVNKQKYSNQLQSLKLLKFLLNGNLEVQNFIYESFKNKIQLKDKFIKAFTDFFQSCKQHIKEFKNVKSEDDLVRKQKKFIDISQEYIYMFQSCISRQHEGFINLFCEKKITYFNSTNIMSEIINLITTLFQHIDENNETTQLLPLVETGIKCLKLIIERYSIDQINAQNICHDKKLLTKIYQFINKIISKQREILEEHEFTKNTKKQLNLQTVEKIKNESAFSKQQLDLQIHSIQLVKIIIRNLCTQTNDDEKDKINKERLIFIIEKLNFDDMDIFLEFVYEHIINPHKRQFKRSDDNFCNTIAHYTRIAFDMFIIQCYLKDIQPDHQSFKKFVQNNFLKQFQIQNEKNQINIQPQYLFLSTYIQKFMKKKFPEQENQTTSDYYLFFRQNVGLTTIKYNNKDYKIYFYKNPSNTYFHNQTIFDDILYQSLRDGDSDQLQHIINKRNFYKSYMQQRQSLYRFCVPLYYFIDNWEFLKQLDFMLMIAINIIQIFNYNDIVYDKQAETTFEKVIEILMIIQIVLCSFYTSICIVDRYNLKDIEFDQEILKNNFLQQEAGQSMNEYEYFFFKEQNEIYGILKKLYINMKLNMFTDKQNVQNYLLLFLSFICVFNIVTSREATIVYSCMLMINYLFRNKNLLSILEAVTTNKMILFKMFFFMANVLLIYGIIVFKSQTLRQNQAEVIQQYGKNIENDSPFIVFIFSILKDAFIQGISAKLGAQKYIEQEDDVGVDKVWTWTYRYLLDFSFFIIVTQLITNMFFAIIIDSQGDIRAEKDKINLIMQETCFICLQKKADIVKQSNEVGWIQHKYMEHNVSHFIFYLIYIESKPIEQCSILEQYIINDLKTKNNYTFIPRKEEEEEVEEEQEEQ